jgi:hypothetical protein
MKKHLNLTIEEKLLEKSKSMQNRRIQVFQVL